MNNELLTALRYKCEGTDVDFKQEQYRFINATDHQKSELLKDILAMANAWREGPGYILVGLKDQRPHPAAAVGIAESIDDAALQQFVNSKVKPKLRFSYEEHLYEGQTIGVITIPRQKRPFFLTQPYGKLQRNIVYVRSGSSTEEAEPSEVIDMGLEEVGRADIVVDLSVLTPSNDPLPESFALRFLKFERRLPDFEMPREKPDPLGLSLHASFWRDNVAYWREVGEYVRVESALIQMQFVLLNRSDVQFSNAKVEVYVEPLDGQSVEMFASAEIPALPKPQWGMHESRQPPSALFRHHVDRFMVDNEGPVQVCHVRLGTLLPGEKGRSADALAIVPHGPGRLRVRTRILAAELASPMESDQVLETTGDVQSFDLDGLRAFLKERANRLRQSATEGAQG